MPFTASDCATVDGLTAQGGVPACAGARTPGQAAVDRPHWDKSLTHRMGRTVKVRNGEPVGPHLTHRTRAEPGMAKELLTSRWR